MISNLVLFELGHAPAQKSPAVIRETAWVGRSFEPAGNFQRNPEQPQIFIKFPAGFRALEVRGDFGSIT
jgi:hypothetical protein